MCLVKEEIERLWQVRYFKGETYIRYGIFGTKKQAENIANRLSGDGNPARVVVVKKDKYLIYVRAYLKGLP